MIGGGKGNRMHQRPATSRGVKGSSFLAPPVNRRPFLCSGGKGSERVTLRVRDWERNFENHDTRKLRTLKWVPVPNKLDGSGYRSLVGCGDKAIEVFGAWVLILEVASRCPVRGVLEKDGEAIGPRELALKTGMNQSSFDLAIPVLVNIGWLEAYDKSPGTSRNFPQLPGTSRTFALEGKGREGNYNNKRGTLSEKAAKLPDGDERLGDVLKRAIK